MTYMALWTNNANKTINDQLRFVMNNKEFIAEMAQSMGTTQKQISAMTQVLSEIICSEMGNGNDVQLGTLGSLEVKTKEQRIIINPKTKNRMLVPPKLVAEFKPSRQLKTDVNSTTK